MALPIDALQLSSDSVDSLRILSFGSSYNDLTSKIFIASQHPFVPQTKREVRLKIQLFEDRHFDELYLPDGSHLDDFITLQLGKTP